MACSFYFYDAYDRHNQLLKFSQELHLFLDIYFVMNIMMEMVREDILTTHFGSNWSRATFGIADISTERACQSKW